MFAPPGPGEVLDPRRPVETGRAAIARIATHEDAARLGRWWGARVLEWHQAGIAGVRLLGLARLPGWALPAILRGLRAACPACRMLGWTPGLDWHVLESLDAGAFDAVFPSLPWWDWQADWLWDEMERLGRIAPLIACPEAPEASPPPPPLIAPHHTPEQGLAAVTRAVMFAAGLGSGWMLPAGLEFGLSGRTPRSPGGPDAVRAAGPLDLRESIRAANAIRTEAALAGDDPPRLATGAGAPALALLRTGGADPRIAERAAVLLVNTDLERAQRVAAAAVLAAAAGRFAEFTPVLPKDAPPLAPGAEPVLAPGEVRLYTAEPAAGIAPAGPPAGTREAAEHAAREPRVAIENVTPRVEGGRFPAKRVVGETVTVEADVICDGHDQISVAMQWRGPGDKAGARPMARDADARARQRPLARRACRSRAWGATYSPSQALARRVRQLPRRAAQEARGRRADRISSCSEGQELVAQAAARASEAQARARQDDAGARRPR